MLLQTVAGGLHSIMLRVLLIKKIATKKALKKTSELYSI